MKTFDELLELAKQDMTRTDGTLPLLASDAYSWLLRRQDVIKSHGEQEGEERFDYISDAQARELFGTEDDDTLPDGRVRVCQGEWFRIPGGYYFDGSAGLLHPETADPSPVAAGMREAISTFLDQGESRDAVRCHYCGDTHAGNQCRSGGGHDFDPTGETIWEFDGKDVETLRAALRQEADR